MDLISIKDDETRLVICDSCATEETEQFLRKFPKKTVVTPQKLMDIQENTSDAVLVDLPEDKLTDIFLRQVIKTLKPGAKLVILKVTKDVNNVEFLLKTSGFTNVEVRNENIVSMKPKYEIGSSAKLNLKKPAPVWKIDDDVDEDETIDPDNLLDEEDLKKPDPSSLRVCGTTGERKACKDCSCGLAEELANEAKTGQVIDTTNAPKSSCGNCYLGDAFRCASCPYLGMPAFKPGEKIQLSDTLLKADI